MYNKPAMILLTVLLMGAQCEKPEDKNHHSETRNIPSSIKEEHEELHRDLAEVIKLGGNTGQAAQKVAEVLEPHFIKEEKYALPPLALLQDLAADKYDESMAETALLSQKLKTELPIMLEEHQHIVGLLDDLLKKAGEENHPDAVSFAKRLKAHAESEEQILYPASILVGEYIQLKEKCVK
jgi:hypothetical protein